MIRRAGIVTYVFYRPEKSFVSLTKFVCQNLSLMRNNGFNSFALDMLFNLGKAEGSVDAGQMIKPALARGLQLVGATTRKLPDIPHTSI